MMFNSLIWDVTAKGMRIRAKEEEKYIPLDSYSSL